MRSEFGSHLEKSLFARFPLIVDKNERYVSRLTTRRKSAQKAESCNLGFLVRTDWEKLAGSHLDSHIAVICPRRRVFREIALVDRSPSSRAKCLHLIGSRLRMTERTSRSPPPRATTKEKRARGPLSPCDPGQGRKTFTANSRRRRGVQRRCATARGTYRWSR